MTYHVYVSNGGAEKLSKFRMDGRRGTLVPQEGIALEGPTGSLAVDREERFLFASLRRSRLLASYRIDRTTGGLAPINSVRLEADACYIATDRRDRYLLSSYYRAGRVAVHPILEDGSLGAEPIEWIATAEHAHSIQTDPSNRFAFVPHTNPSNMIAQFRFDDESGRLTPNDPPRFEPDTPEGPRHFCFHPHLDVLYSVNENGSSVTAHRFDPVAGTLSAFQTLSTLPLDFSGENTCAEIAITPSGAFLYASNRGHDSLASFAVDATSGELTALTYDPTEKTPRMFALDPAGHFLYAAGQASGRLASYRIDPDTGRLEALEVHEVGPGPMWVQFVRASG